MQEASIAVIYYLIMTLSTFAKVNQNNIYNFENNEFQKSNILTFGNCEVVICTGKMFAEVNSEKTNGKAHIPALSVDK